MRICLLISIQYTNVMDGQTDVWPDGHCTASCGKNDRQRAHIKKLKLELN